MPLLFEKNLGSRYHETLALTVKPDVQMARLLTRPNTTKEHAQRRIDSQMSQREKSLRAGYIIDNSGDLDTFHNSLDIYFNGVRERAAKRLQDSNESNVEAKKESAKCDSDTDADLTGDKAGRRRKPPRDKTKRTTPTEPAKSVPLDPAEAKKQSDQLRGLLKDFVPLTGDMALSKIGDVGTTKHKESSASLTLNVDTRDCDESGKKCSDHTHEIGVDVHMWVKQKHGKSTTDDTCGCGCGKTCRSGCACSSGCGCTCPVPPVTPPVPPVTPLVPPVTPPVPPVTPPVPPVTPPVPPVTPPPCGRPWYRRRVARTVMVMGFLALLAYLAFLATLVYVQSTHYHDSGTGTGTTVTATGKTPVGTGKDPDYVHRRLQQVIRRRSPVSDAVLPSGREQEQSNQPFLRRLRSGASAAMRLEHLTDVPSFAFDFTPNWVRAQTTSWTVTYQDGCSTANVVGADKDNNVVSEQEYRKGLTFVNRYDINRQAKSIQVDRFQSFGQFVGRTTYNFDALNQLISIDRFDGHSVLLANATATGTRKQSGNHHPSLRCSHGKVGRNSDLLWRRRKHCPR